MTTTLTLAGVRRELYLCDDGKDANKRAWLETNYGEGSGNASKGRVHYVYIWQVRWPLSHSLM